MSDMMKDPMVLRQIIMDHYQYPRNHQLTKAEGGKAYGLRFLHR